MSKSFDEMLIRRLLFICREHGAKLQRIVGLGERIDTTVRIARFRYLVITQASPSHRLLKSICQAHVFGEEHSPYPNPSCQVHAVVEGCVSAAQYKAANTAFDLILSPIPKGVRKTDLFALDV